ncbi:MAG: RNA polymerase factor sigma-54, partial [Rhodocyclaceae bacterium]
MKQTLQLKLSQHLALTPQLQQSIRLLQLSSLELDQEIEQALQKNPLLERVEPGETALYGSAQDASSQPRDETPASAEERIEATAEWSEDGFEWPAAGAKGPRDPNDEDVDAGEMQAAATSLADHLIGQLALSQLSGRERLLVAFLIEALDEDGYLGQPLEELAEALPPELIGEPDEVVDDLQIALRHLQSFDPPGVGARNPRECLLLQLQNLPATPARELARTIVSDHLERLASRDYARIKKATGCDDEALRGAHDLIRSLNPRPGAQFAALDTRFVVPDVIVKKLNGQWVVHLNQEAMPRLRIN